MKFRSLAVCSFLTMVTACSPNTASDGSNPTEPTVRPPVTYHKNGTVETGDLRFATVEAFQHSQDFFTNGRRCEIGRAHV